MATIITAPMPGQLTCLFYWTILSGPESISEWTTQQQQQLNVKAEVHLVGALAGQNVNIKKFKL